MSGQETTEDEHEAEVEQPTGQSQRPVRIRKPPTRYGELILNYLQQMLEDKEPIKTLKPKLLKKLFILSVR